MLNEFVMQSFSKLAMSKIESMVEMWLWVTYMLYYLMFIFNKDIWVKFNLGGL